MSEEDKTSQQSEDEELSSAESTQDRFGRLWSDMKKGLKDIGSVAVEKAEEFGKLASEKAEELTRTGKLRLDIMQYNRSMNRAFAKIGEEAYQLQASGKLKDLVKTETFLVAQQEIDSLKQKIVDTEAEITRVQAEEQAESQTAEDTPAGDE